MNFQKPDITWKDKENAIKNICKKHSDSTTLKPLAEALTFLDGEIGKFYEKYVFYQIHLMGIFDDNQIHKNVQIYATQLNVLLSQDSNTSILEKTNNRVNLLKYAENIQTSGSESSSALELSATEALKKGEPSQEGMKKAKHNQDKNNTDLRMMEVDITIKGVTPLKAAEFLKSAAFIKSLRGRSLPALSLRIKKELCSTLQKNVLITNLPPVWSYEPD